MQRFFAHATVSMLLVSLILSGCYSSRNLAQLADRDAVTIEQARYDALWATPREQLSAMEVAERDRLQRTQLERISVREGTEKEFDRRLLIQRDSIILDQSRYEVLLSTTDSELGQAEAAELETLQRQQAERDRALTNVEAVLKDRHVAGWRTFALVFTTVVASLAAIIAKFGGPSCC